MTDSEKLRQHLKQAYMSSTQLDEDEHHKSLKMVAALHQQMLCDSKRIKQRLAELGSTVKTNRSQKARAKLTRTSNSQSPQSPLKPVQTTNKNEFR